MAQNNCCLYNAGCIKYLDQPSKSREDKLNGFQTSVHVILSV